MTERRLTERPLVVLAGASGFIGSHLLDALVTLGFEVRRLQRSAPERIEDNPTAQNSGVAYWNPSEGICDEEHLADAAAVICLNGANLIGRPWTDSYKTTLLRSRIDSVNTIVDAIGRLPKSRRPRAFLSGSAVGIYGFDRGDEKLTEESSYGEGFLADLCIQWEAAAQRAQDDYGVRTVLLRTGLVLGPEAGLLPMMVIPYRLGLGAQLGSGQSWMPVISVVDHVRAMVFCLTTPSIEGPVNLVCPEPLRNEEFHENLSHYLARPAFLKAPEVLLRTLGGQMAQEVILASQRALPHKLLAEGFMFTAPTAFEILGQVLPARHRR
ncbi:TIGR01777 family oxidoreductase [Schaalia canis]|uniref:TIGR01777 family protein n=1 Tax=Schaalia canis TaxID=100469 RepID=A0A3P1SHG9_9ACTO|nr:TIGR01777 family oxidoreductase [Schaalia canis]RRC96369.1 TIGR01777 family protein [Schaalia canis]